ncbi:MAG: hydroxymethylglutaryl-CoA lyase [Pseudomonadota bacterium]
MVRSVEIVEVGPRDGLQNEKKILTTEEKLSLIQMALKAGVRRLEATSFVHPKRVPQMADAEDLALALPDIEGVTFIGLVLNLRGAERAAVTRLQEFGAVALASDTFGRKNQGQSSMQSVVEASKIVRFAQAEGRRASVTLSAAWGCPFEGEVSHDHVVDMAKAVADAGPHEIALADTIGVADPWNVEELLSKVADAVPGMPLRAHFHNTRNTGLANAYAAVRAGVATLDASFGGIGGCPFAPAATGNIPTEDLIYQLHRGGVETGIGLHAAIELGRQVAAKLDGAPGMLMKAGVFPPPPHIGEQNVA